MRNMWCCFSRAKSPDRLAFFLAKSGTPAARDQKGAYFKHGRYATWASRAADFRSESQSEPGSWRAFKRRAGLAERGTRGEHRGSPHAANGSTWTCDLGRERVSRSLRAPAQDARAGLFA